MKIRFGKWVVKHKTLIFVISLLLLIPSVFGFLGTRVNYDILSYLPGNIDTMKGQDILVNEFGTGAFSLVVTEGMTEKDVAKTKSDIEAVDQVAKVVWYNTVADLSIPMEVLPDDLYQKFNHGDTTLMMVIFKDTTSSDNTMDAIEEIRGIVKENCFVSGMSAVVTDTRNLVEKEVPMYVLIAAGLSLLVLMLTLDSFLVPVFFMLSIGMAIVYNLGSNIFQGEISYITQALTAVLQLGVTMDYSIFLWHSYEEQQIRFHGDKNRAMAHAISNSISAVFGSSVTTVAGFIALCFMSFTLGLDLGIVMAKGVILGVLCCVTVLPSMILIFDKAVEKSRHKALLPELKKIGPFVTKHYRIFAVLFIVLLVPALYGYTKTDVYYNLDATLPKDLDSIAANQKLEDNFNMNAVDMVLVRSSLDQKDVRKMTREIQQEQGVSWVLGLESLVGPAIPEEMIPEDLLSVVKTEDWELLLVGSEYKIASEEMGRQCENISSIIKKYDQEGMLVGEAPCTEDLIKITDQDFKTVSAVSIGVIFLIIMVVFKSVSLPAILVCVIELAIFINMGIPYYTGTALPFIASIVIGTIQLGATVDYAILMTTRYRKERDKGQNKKEAVQIALQTSAKSVLVSAFSFFAATIGVGVYSSVDMIGSLCMLMARGALISMAVVILILPSMLLIFDWLICRTTIGAPKINKKSKKMTQEVLK
ncbi:efflux RND transporter permease subunit [Cuneatibacter caecimuris]|uniref:SSD domain-containing protein n=1 Tax=Cuneatibacter caecimuris TaxID=1796618 RepID=A0A4Q7P2K3_9FIRM|nr:MMPL family transporter [Cuneatibacter caecimuris]RZS94005.1 hypothetical protein EV209_2367 [Cuneatibacter caecimuris]